MILTVALEATYIQSSCDDGNFLFRREKIVTFYHRLFSIVFIFVIPACPAFASHPETGLRRSAVVRAVEKVRPAVVNINTRQVVRESHPFYRFQDPFFDRFFDNFFEPYQREYESTNLGSGVIIDEGGHVLTNEHVVMAGADITVTLADGREYAATIVGSDPETDLAVLKIQADAVLPHIAIGRSDDLMIGETVIAIGNPFGLSHSVTTGVVSALHRSFKTDGDRVYADLIQTDASINPGNSGGPLLTIEGELIGINTAIYGGAAKGIGFAIPISRAHRIIDDLISFGHVRKAWLGLRVIPVTVGSKQISPRSVKEIIEIQVKAVFPDGPAYRAGIRMGDVLTAVGSVKLALLSDFTGALTTYTAGDKISLELGGGKRRLAEVVTTVIPLDKVSVATREMLGIAVGTISDYLKRRLRYHGGGVMVERVLTYRGAAAKAGIRPGDIIRQVNDRRIAGVDDYGQAILEAYQGQRVLLLIQRASRGYYLTLTL